MELQPSEIMHEEATWENEGGAVPERPLGASARPSRLRRVGASFLRAFTDHPVAAATAAFAAGILLGGTVGRARRGRVLLLLAQPVLARAAAVLWAPASR